LEWIGSLGIDIGFFMFSGANWYPMMYSLPEEKKLDLVRRRRQALLKSLVQRVKVTKCRSAVPAAGPCTVLDPELLWLNTEERGIFIDPETAIVALLDASVAAEPHYMAATDVWSSESGFEPIAPRSFRMPRQKYIQEAAERLAPSIVRARETVAPASNDLANQLPKYFNELVAAQTARVRKLINAKLALAVSGPRGGEWTIDFTSDGSTYAADGILPDWTYKIEVEDKVISPFITGEDPFFEHLLLSFKFRAARRPDEYNEPLYHFLYEPDPEKLHNWYAATS
jgi:hypothetical protein